MAIGGVTNDPHVYPVATADILLDNRRFCEERFGCRPTTGVGDIGVGRIRCIAVLIDEVPEFLRCEVKDLRGSSVASAYGCRIEIVEGRRLGLREVCERDVDEVISGLFRCTCEDVIRPVVVDNGRILDACQHFRVAFGVDKGSTGTPFESTRKSA